MSSSLIAGAVSLLLIIISGYVIATGILTIAESTIYTQSDITYNQEQMRLTSVTINSSWDGDSVPKKLYINAFNNGSTSFTKKDFEKMDLFTYPGNDGKMNKTSVNSCNPHIPDNTTDPVHGDIINIGMWDPAEVLKMEVPMGTKPDRVIFVTPNGITAYSSVI